MIYRFWLKLNYVITKTILNLYEISLKKIGTYFIFLLLLHLILNFLNFNKFIADTFFYPSILNYFFFNLEIIFMMLLIFLQKERFNFLISTYNLNNLWTGLNKEFFQFWIILNFWNFFSILFISFFYKNFSLHFEVFTNLYYFNFYLCYCFINFLIIYIILILINTLLTQILFKFFFMLFFQLFLNVKIFNLFFENYLTLINFILNFNLFEILIYVNIINLLINLLIEFCKDFVIIYSLR